MALKVVLSEAMSIHYNGNLAVVNAIPLVRRLDSENQHVTDDRSQQHVVNVLAILF